MIPRVLHRIWFGPSMPPEFERYGEAWQRLNPHWEIRLWTEDNLPPLTNQRLWDAAPDLVESGLVNRMRSDIARYEILLAYGGLYVDTDFEPLRPIDGLIADHDMFAVAENQSLIANGFVGCTPDHPFMRHIVERLPESVDARPGQPPWRTTGPEFITRCSKERPGKLALLPQRLVIPYHHRQLLKDGSPPPIPEDAFAHHVWASCRQSVSVIIPWRAGCPHREASRQYIGERFAAEYPSWQVVDADCTDEMWNKAEAIIDGTRRSFGDIVVVHDADVWCDDLSPAVETVKNGAAWAMPYRELHRLTPDATAEVLSGSASIDDVAHRVAEPVYRGVDGGGLLVVRRKHVESVPPDVRFRGWGGEDEAWAWALSTLVGPMWRGKARLIHFWHPPQQRRSRNVGSVENEALWNQYRLARGKRDRMDRLVQRKPLKRVATFQHTITGRLWMAKVGTEVYDRYRKHRYLREVVGEPPKDF
jgi:hypothetical protein